MVNYRLLFMVFVLIAAGGALGFMNLELDTNVARSLPANDRVIADGLEIFNHHPIHDQVAVDIMINRDDPDTLVECGAILERKLTAGGLFAQVGTDSVGALIPRLAFHAARNLPLLFSAKELQEADSLLEPERIKERLRRLYNDLGSLDGVGQAEFISLDPLGLKDRILAKMALMAPSDSVRLYRGKLLSGDGRHLLVTARPLAAGTDTAAARRISDLFAQAARELAEEFEPNGVQVTLTPVGAYRAALDNERIIRHDVEFALILATAGIALLLLVSFSRPLIGLLSLVPALAGMAAALLVYSLLFPSISIMVLGFGGAIISITVDHGIAYLLFLDRPHETRGREASHEVKAVGMMTVVTTVAAFLILSTSGFPIFTELGLFTALGILFSFLFVHLVFPKIIPVMPAGRRHALPLQNLVNLLYRTGRPGAIAALLLASFLLFFARPQFEVSLSSMNTVSQATQAADARFTEVWGKIGDRLVLMSSAESIVAAQRHNDLVLARIEADVEKEVLASAFVPSMIFPGSERAARNLAAWQAFWDKGRAEQVERALNAAGAELGFTSGAFAPFFRLLDPGLEASPPDIPAEYHGLLGISQDPETSGLIQFITLAPGKNYDAADFLARYGGESRIFDAAHFTERLADILFSTFAAMLVIIAVSVALLLLAVSLNPVLTLLTLLPAVFAYVCTLGTLKIIGRPLDIPALMLSIVIFGMGIDYAIFCVRAHQRYREISHPSYAQVRSSVFLAGVSTLVGFGVLCFADHSLLRSIGITSFLGIGYSLLGAFLLLPPLLVYYFAGKGPQDERPPLDPRRRVRRRYRTLEAYPRMFVRGKLRFDPMFEELPRLLALRKEIGTILDIGCGYGVPACWCLENFEDARVIGLEPDPERARIAAIALGARGTVSQGWAPDLPAVPDGSVDVVLLLDMLHYLDDQTAAAVFSRSFQALAPGGILAARFVIRPEGRPSWSWRLEDARVRIAGRRPFYRSAERMAALLEAAGVVLIINELTAANPELVWMVGRAEKGEPCGTRT